ncbi:MAG: pilus assembly protein PilP [Proteobacteria bacterium]|nr:pilus assembly protein PilP [Pseudomonadota bacterium]
MMKWTRLLLVMLPLTLSACGNETHADLEAFIKDSGKGLRGQVIPVPEVHPYTHYPYSAFEIPNPFKPRKSKHTKGEGGGLQPDLDRHKEVLEKFPLESLKMVGSLERDKNFYALIKAPDSTLHRVKAGGYLGQNFGLISNISEAEVNLKEIVQYSTGDWAERISTLMLEDQE